MKSETELVTVPPALAAEVQAVATEEHRAAADVVRDALENYLEIRRWQQHTSPERAQAVGLPNDGIAITSEYRQAMREKIAQGLRSLREGKGTDGEVFIAQMDAELAELEHQGRQ